MKKIIDFITEKALLEKMDGQLLSPIYYTAWRCLTSTEDPVKQEEIVIKLIELVFDGYKQSLNDHMDHLKKCMQPIMIKKYD